MNLTQARDALIARLKTYWDTNHAAIPVVYDNTPFDPDRLGNQFIECEVAFVQAKQIDLGAAPATRIAGFLYLTVYTKQGQGSRDALTLLDELSVLFSRVSLGNLQLETATPAGTSVNRGWFCTELKVPFWCTST